MNAMLLAAGRGTRLRAVEPGIPKALVDIAGKPLLARQLEYLESQGVSRVVVNAHHLADSILAFAREHRGSIELVVIVERELLGTAGGVRNALAGLGDDPFIVLYGDVLTDEALAPMVELHSKRGVAATLAAYASRDVEGKGTIAVDGSDLITGFTEKGTTTAREEALINAGIYVLEPSFVRAVPPGGACDFGHDVFPAALSRGERLAVHRLAAPVLDVGTPAALALARSQSSAS